MSIAYLPVLALNCNCSLRGLLLSSYRCTVMQRRDVSPLIEEMMCWYGLSCIAFPAAIFRPPALRHLFPTPRGRSAHFRKSAASSLANTLANATLNSLASTSGAHSFFRKHQALRTRLLQHRNMCTPTAQAQRAACLPSHTQSTSSRHSSGHTRRRCFDAQGLRQARRRIRLRRTYGRGRARRPGPHRRRRGAQSGCR